ncbi:MAG: FHA domain-containing protein [Planctomycetota bacterium]
MNVSLVMFKADGARKDFPLLRNRVVIGRKSSCDLRIPLTSVSRQHCEITLDESKILVKDLGSSNGTFHNSVRVQEASLSAGDELVIGPVVFTVVVDGVPDRIKPVRTILSSSMASASYVAQTVGGVGSKESGSSGSSASSSGSGGPGLPEDEGIEATLELDDDAALSALEAAASDDGDDDDEFSLLIDEELEDDRG